MKIQSSETVSELKQKVESLKEPLQTLEDHQSAIEREVEYGYTRNQVLIRSNSWDIIENYLTKEVESSKLFWGVTKNTVVCIDLEGLREQYPFVDKVEITRESPSLDHYVYDEVIYDSTLDVTFLISFKRSMAIPFSVNSETLRSCIIALDGMLYSLSAIDNCENNSVILEEDDLKVLNQARILIKGG